MKITKAIPVDSAIQPGDAARESPPLYLSPVAAGFPSPAEDYIDRKLDLHEYPVRNPAATFFVRAAGDSMIHAGIQDSDLLVVDRSVMVMPDEHKEKDESVNLRMIYQPKTIAK